MTLTQLWPSSPPDNIHTNCIHYRFWSLSVNWESNNSQQNDSSDSDGGGHNSGSSDCYIKESHFQLRYLQRYNMKSKLCPRDGELHYRYEAGAKFSQQKHPTLLSLSGVFSSQVIIWRGDITRSPLSQQNKVMVIILWNVPNEKSKFCG